MATEKDIIITQIGELKMWFDFYYAHNEQKYRRLNTLQLKTDDGLDPYSELIKLYNVAEEKRKLIQSLESKLNLLI